VGFFTLAERFAQFGVQHLGRIPEAIVERPIPLDVAQGFLQQRKSLRVLALEP